MSLHHSDDDEKKAAGSLWPSPTVAVGVLGEEATDGNFGMFKVAKEGVIFGRWGGRELL